jgi:hypothetical protein
VLTAFGDFEAALGPVGAANALRLLAPRFLPLWDRAIAIAIQYTRHLRRTGTNGGHYLEFMRECREQSIAVGGDTATAERNMLKALDE